MLALAAIALQAAAADYGNAPHVATIRGPALRLTDRPPLCAPAEAGCIETSLGGDVWPIADQDRIVVDWGYRVGVGPVVARTRHLYIPIEPAADESTPAPVTIDIDASGARLSLVVSQGGSRHRIEIDGGAWIELPLGDDSHRLFARLESH